VSTDTPIHDTLAGVTELAMLEELFEHEAGCESAHSHSTCSTVVVARVHRLGDGAKYLTCQNGVNVNMKFIALGHQCRCCGEYCADCWRIIPI
jgi:hypothetical protein